MTTKVGVAGAAGFAGVELVRLLIAHPEFELACITSDALDGRLLAESYPAFSGVSDISFSSHDNADFAECDMVFLAVPHTAAMGMAPGLLDRGISVVDLSADFRLKDASVYEQWYKTSHTAKHLLPQAAFGLPELFEDQLAQAAESFAAGGAVLVGCAGCYPTATSLAAAPAIEAGLVSDAAAIVADAVSGVTGAGKKASERTHFCFANENVEAYGVGTHRHTPEIEQILGIEGRLVFTPHLAPLNRGLLSTVNLPLKEGCSLPSTEELVELYRRRYGSSPLVEVLPAGALPRTASVAGTCRAHIGVVVHERARMIVAVGAIDNLGKGAAGQAVQCANIVCGLPQDCGLQMISVPV